MHENNLNLKLFLQSGSDEMAGSVSNLVGDRKRQLPAFWLPSCGPQAKKTKAAKPDKTVYCPMSRQPIRMKDLIEVQWTIARDPDDKKSLIAR